MLAAEAPAHLRGLILCCTFAKCPQPLLKPLRPFVGLMVFSSLPALLARLGHRALFGRFANAQTQAALSASLRNLHPAVLRSRMRAVLDVDMTPLLSRIHLPVLYLSAQQDRVVSPSALRYLARALPHTQIARIAAPHMLLQTVPDAAWQAVLPFLRGLDNDA
jgi:pimeloyl-ACP methyl ester carboxylesterase